MSYHSKPLASVIASYRAQNSNRIVSKHWRLVIQELSWSIAEAQGKFWSLELETNEHYTYVLLDPRYPGSYNYVLPSGRKVHFSHRPFYVGKGKGLRSSVHSTDKALSTSDRKTNVIKAIRRAGLMEITKQSKEVYNVTDWLAQAYEVDLIAGLGRLSEDGPLTNVTPGAGGCVGYRHTERARKLMSLKAKRRAPRSEEVRRRSSEVQKNRPWSEARRAAQEARQGLGYGPLKKPRGPWSEARRAAQLARKGKPYKTRSIK